jgi:hypothetical protein
MDHISAQGHAATATGATGSLSSATLTRSGQIELPTPIAALLRWAHAQERAVTGADAHATHRFTNDLLGGVVAAGYSPDLVAKCLAVTERSVVSRVGPDGWLPASRIIIGAGVDLHAIERWRSDGLLPPGRPGPLGELYYPALDVVRVLANIDKKPTGSSRPISCPSGAAIRTRSKPA